MTTIRHFKPVLTVLGVLYIIMASSMLVRGVIVLRDFGVPESAIAEPVLVDIFIFFYQLMALMGVFTCSWGTSRANVAPSCSWRVCSSSRVS